ncbi:hypothetical protein KYJ26_14300 [Bacillus sp. MCCB 382]|uniref:hypothetical protein n=1 Tax=Bacillus sp. MCCB 382 TaxID=2860197 RepID=UPI001C58CE81|nr:hypothetical protein [Bacillus sp. MCCB 382]
MPETVAVLMEKVSNLEREMRDVKQELRDHVRENDIEHDKMNDDIVDVATSIGRVEIMFTHIKDTQSDMKQEISKIAASAGRDQGWRALITDLIKIILLICGFVASGKFFF